MSRDNPMPPSRNDARGGQRADGYGTGPRQNTHGGDPLDDRMPSRGKTSGFTGRNGANVSAADINRGFLRPGDPPDTPSRDSWERSGYEPNDPSRQTPTGRPEGGFDSFDGGFLDRDPFSKHERG